MTDYAGTLPPSFRPWESHNPPTKSFANVLGRIYAERGNFRDITEASLQDEVTTSAIAGPSSPSSAASDDEGPPAQDARPRAEQLQAARRDVIGHVASAQNEVLLALDFVSLLLSKDVKQAESTMSPVLKQSVPAGSLGMDIWEGMGEDAAREKQDGLLARGKRLEGLRGAAEGLGRAEERLRVTVEKERKYWDGILKLREEKWSVCRIPGERGMLGVRYGFPEAMGEFKGRGLAALRMGADGQVVLDRGLGRSGKGLRVRIKKGKEVLGESHIKENDDDEADVGTRIKMARDSLFEEELWHEAMREGREMGGYGVHMKGNTIVMPLGYVDEPSQDLDSFSSLEIDLVSTEDHYNPAKPDRSANGIATALRLLLSNTHRERLERRSQVPLPLSSEKPDRPISRVIRPLLTHLHQRSASIRLHSHLAGVKAILSKAELNASISGTGTTFTSLSDITSTKQLLETLTKSPMSNVTLEVSSQSDKTEPLSLTVSHTTEFSPPSYGTLFTLTSAGSDDTRQTNSLRDLLEAVNNAISAWLTEDAARYFDGWEADKRAFRVVKPHGLETSGGQSEEVEILLAPSEGSGKMELRVSFPGKDTVWSENDSNERSWADALKG
ncbi:hypothetical protein CAC42_3271 [Sphaceloma murrayae]|uniref:Mediator of RNA polymerase II transcription subunit 17 n=1 Tax=Sphaceloma murrayae TaxID=2082308 RepID=A0A2K1QFF3_9PEZI|nr:hypothetical protein CAC42_3271 [Sphaceloma murrayae]